MTKFLMCVIGAVLFIVGLLCRFHPRMVLPDSMSWSGDFAYSKWGLRLDAFADVMNIIIFMGALMIVLSLTRFVPGSFRLPSGDANRVPPKPLNGEVVTRVFAYSVLVVLAVLVFVVIVVALSRP